MDGQKPHFLARLFRFTSKIAPNELKACLLSFLMVFILMCSYYILRPIRDGMASDWTDAEVSFLWTLNFFISTAAVAFYGWTVARIRFDWLVPGVYTFFAASFAFFYFGRIDLLNKVFYVWVSVFSLFNISVFWSFMSDLFTKEQASRLFPIIAAGASAGALVGPAFPTLFSRWLGTENLLLIVALLLIPAIPLSFKLRSLKTTELGNQDLQVDLSHARIGGNPFAGFRNFFTNRYLISIGSFIMLYTAISSIVYFQQKNLLEEYDLINRTQILGTIDWIVNILTFTIAFFATGRIVQNCGMPFTLSCIPFAMVAGLLTLAASPILMVALSLQVSRRAGNYAVTRPAREMLFTQVSREDRFKAKPVIDIVAYRGGDMITSWAFAALTQGLGFGLAAMAAIGAVVAAMWGLVGLFLGRRFDRPTSNKI